MKPELRLATDELPPRFRPRGLVKCGMKSPNFFSVAQLAGACFCRLRRSPTFNSTRRLRQI